LLHDEVAQLEGAFVDAITARDVRAAVAALLDLDTAIERRVGAGDDGPELQAARATSRSLIVRLGEVAGDGTRDPREVVAPYVETMLELRARARAAQDWPTADLLRERLTAAGIEVRDDPAGSSWTLAEREDG
jgi:cysteinyl-tRNA synthetase